MSLALENHMLAQYYQLLTLRPMAERDHVPVALHNGTHKSIEIVRCRVRVYIMAIANERVSQSIKTDADNTLLGEQ